MQLSCLPVSIFDCIDSGRMSLGAWFEEAAKLGFDGADLSNRFLRNHSAEFIKKTANELEANKIKSVLMSAYPDFTQPEPELREKEIMGLQHDISVCSDLGIKFIRILSGQAYPGMNLETGLARVLDCFEIIAAYGERYKVRPVFENQVNLDSWQFGDFSASTDVFLKICSLIKDRELPIGINFDTGNVTARGEDPVRVLGKVIDMVETLHISDMSEMGKFSPALIGTGVTPNEEVLSFLKHDGFDGWICIEEASFTGFTGIKMAHDCVRRMWKES